MSQLIDSLIDEPWWLMQIPPGIRMVFFLEEQFTDLSTRGVCIYSIYSYEKKWHKTSMHISWAGKPLSSIITEYISRIEPLVST